MNEIKKALFINCIMAEEAYKRSVRIDGKTAAETIRKKAAYESLLQVIEDAREYEDYRSFRIMLALRCAKEDTRCHLISA